LSAGGMCFGLKIKAKFSLFLKNYISVLTEIAEIKEMKRNEKEAK
jgi:hypothetical protein